MFWEMKRDYDSIKIVCYYACDNDRNRTVLFLFFQRPGNRYYIAYTEKYDYIFKRNFHLFYVLKFTLG